MQTSIIDTLRDTPDGLEADQILRSCTHCGFCTATCPTYQITGDERDSPRGRIYLIKQALEGTEPTERTQYHLDRCLTCRACETTCPSGVKYARLADIGRNLVENKVARSPRKRAVRWALRHVAAYPARFAIALALGRMIAPLLIGPFAALRAKIPRARPNTDTSRPDRNRHARKMLVLEGCVQPSAAPETNAAAARVFDRLGISLVSASAAGCCGALDQHLAARDAALDHVRANIDAWWPYIEAGAEAIVMTASGCGAQVAEYGHMLRNDPHYAKRAARVSELTRDVSDVLAAEDMSELANVGKDRRVAYHPPCTLQNAPGLRDHVAQILAQAGYKPTPVANAHLCCGSAGSYSILQPEMASELRRNKLASLAAGKPEIIATANIGCQLHLNAASDTPVRHWIELLA